MKAILVVWTALAFGINALGAQSTASQEQSPKELVERYWRLETNGERLTTQGWNKLDVLRVRPSPPAQKKVIIVVSPDFSVWDPMFDGSKATVNVGLRIFGEISPDMRFTKNSTTAIKEGRLFTLARTSKHWEVGPDGKSLHEVTGPSEWRIDELGGKIWLNVRTATTYVVDKRGKTNDPVVKKNADGTLAILKRLK